MPDGVDSRSAPEQITAQLHKALVDGSLQPGDRLPPEPKLAESFGVSRSTMREALKLLKGQGLLETQRGSKGGHFVATPRTDGVAAQLGMTFGIWFDLGEISVAEVYEARRIVESACVRLAAVRATQEDIQEMDRILEDQADPAISLQQFLVLDVSFHQAVSTAARNYLLSLPMSAIHIMRPRTNSLMQRHDRGRVISQHRALLDAIASGDPDAADAALSDHMSFLEAQRSTSPNASVADLPSIEDDQVIAGTVSGVEDSDG